LFVLAVALLSLISRFLFINLGFRSRDDSAGELAKPLEW
jgi:hypothetical protein